MCKLQFSRLILVYLYFNKLGCALPVVFVWPECIVNDKEVIARSTQVKILKGDLQKCNDENYFNVFQCVKLHL